MWKEYSLNYLKKNKSTAAFIVIAVFVASMFISLLSTLFYNMWTNDIDRIKASEGDWQARIYIALSTDEMDTLNSFANVENVVLSAENAYADLYFANPSEIYEDMPLIAEKLNISDENIEYHSSLLQKQFIYSKASGEQPAPIELFYFAVVILLCVALILIIKNAFAFSMRTRVRQLGILQSVGATPKQLRLVMFQEASVLSILPAVTGILAGIGLVAIFIRYANSLTAQLGMQGATLHYHILLFLITIIVTMATVFISIWLPAKNLSKLESVELIKEQPLKIKKVKKYTLFSKLFGVEGELARKSIYVRRKEFRTATICLLLSFFVLSVFLNFMTLSEISTQRSYWNRYEDVWDVMVEVSGSKVDDATMESIRKVNGVSSAVLYKTDLSYRALLSEDAFSAELRSQGGYTTYNSSAETDENGEYLINAPLLILDDKSFESYCAQNGIGNIRSDQPSAIVVNKIGDVLYSGSDDANYIEFLDPSRNLSLHLQVSTEDGQIERSLHIIGYTQNVPEVREDFSAFSLLLVLPESDYFMMNDSSAGISYINIKATQSEDLAALQSNISRILNGKFNYTIENRIDSYNTNSQMYEGYKKIVTIICAVIACIGVSNVFANTLGYMQQRKREFAKYQSIGITPKSIAKILFFEALVIGVKPILLSIPFNILFILLTTSSQGITLGDFLTQMPLLQNILFALAVLTAVALSYYICGRKILNANIADVLKNDSN